MLLTEESAVDASDDEGQRASGLREEEGCVLDRSDDYVKCAVNGTRCRTVK